MTDHMLSVRGLTKRFGGLTAVDQASLNVDEGQIVSLIGPNGAGKTTLFAMIAGFHKPDDGAASFAGDDITARSPHVICRKGLVRTFQIVQPFGALSVRENIAVGAHLRLPRRSDALAKAEEVADLVGMSDRLNMPATSLTVAGRKRLEVARALATGPRMLLLDEVMAGLNPTEISDIVPVIRAIRDSGVTILLIEHVMQAVMSLSEYTYVLNNGAMIAEGSPADVTSNQAVVEAYLGQGAATRLAEQREAGGVA
ncbi:MAG: ABC transporter ATP-binding protein [Pseudomonadota bacterium]